MDFGQPKFNVEISQRMANGQLLFLALNMSSLICVHAEYFEWHVMCVPATCVCSKVYCSVYHSNFWSAYMHWDIRTHIKSYLIVDLMLVDTQQLIYYGSKLTFLYRMLILT